MNRAGRYFGAISANFTGPDFRMTRFQGNQAHESTGALAIIGVTTSKIDSCDFLDNICETKLRHPCAALWLQGFAGGFPGNWHNCTMLKCFFFGNKVSGKVAHHITTYGNVQLKMKGQNCFDGTRDVAIHAEYQILLTSIPDPTQEHFDVENRDKCIAYIPTSRFEPTREFSSTPRLTISSYFRPTKIFLPTKTCSSSLIFTGTQGFTQSNIPFTRTLPMSESERFVMSQRVTQSQGFAATERENLRQSSPLSATTEFDQSQQMSSSLQLDRSENLSPSMWPRSTESFAPDTQDSPTEKEKDPELEKPKPKLSLPLGLGLGGGLLLLLLLLLLICCCCCRKKGGGMGDIKVNNKFSVPRQEEFDRKFITFRVQAHGLNNELEADIYDEELNL
jgi:hypothetical protein